MRRILSVLTAIFLIYGIFEIKSLMEDKKTISLLDKTFNQQKPKVTPPPERRATIIIKEKNKVNK
jgi:hypothetical protein